MNLDAGSSFADDIRRIGREVAGDPAVSRRAHRYLWFHGVVAVVGFQSVYWWLMVGARSSLSVSAAAVVLGLVVAGMLMQVDHGASHQRLNAFVYVTKGLVPSALGVAWWIRKHVTSHHGHANTVRDDDLDVIGLLRLSPQRPWRPVHRLQPVLAPLMYPLLHVGMVGKSVKFAFTGQVCGLRPIESGLLWREQCLGIQLGPAAFYLTVSSIVHGVAVTFVVAAIISGVIGTVLSLVFVVEHTVASTRFDDEPHPDWFIHQVLSAADAATDRRTFTWYVGALNHHVEHHLFPRLPMSELPRIRSRVRAACAANGLTHIEYRTWSSAWLDHHRHLRSLARQPAEAPDAAQPCSSHSCAAADPAATASENVR